MKHETNKIMIKCSVKIITINEEYALSKWCIVSVYYKYSIYSYELVYLCDKFETHVLSVPDVMSSVTSTMHFLPLEGPSQES